MFVDLSDAQKKFSETLQKFEFNCSEGEQTEDEKVICKCCLRIV